MVCLSPNPQRSISNVLQPRARNRFGNHNPAMPPPTMVTSTRVRLRVLIGTS